MAKITWICVLKVSAVWCCFDGYPWSIPSIDDWQSFADVIGMHDPITKILQQPPLTVVFHCTTVTKRSSYMYLAVSVHTVQASSCICIPKLDMTVSSTTTTGQDIWLPWTPCHCLEISKSQPAKSATFKRWHDFSTLRIFWGKGLVINKTNIG